MSGYGGAANDVSDYFNRVEPEPKPKKPKLKKKPIYKIVTNQYLHTFLEEVNAFLEENPDYEVSDDKLRFKENNHIALFKLKNTEPQTVTSKVTVK